MLANFFRARRLLENAPAVSAGQDDSAFEEDPALSPVAPSRYLSGRVLDIARASVQLAELGPQLALFAAELEGQAQTQAARAASIAQTMAALTQNLDQAVSALRASSEQVGETLAVVERIAMQTRILSVNASIEAARAGEQGRSFGVVVEEVQRLADRTGGSTHEIETCVREMQTRIAQVEAVAGLRAVEGSMATSCNVGAVQREVEGLNASAGDQLQSARVLHSMGVHVNALTESLLLSVGAFRFEAHQRAERILRELVPVLVDMMPERERVEAALEAWLQDNPSFELAYVTDASGIQIVDNVVRSGAGITRDSVGMSRDWSERPWFQESVRNNDVSSTDIYRSAANNDFCFTVAVALRDAAGTLLGVLGADVNFRRLIVSA